MNKGYKPMSSKKKRKKKILVIVNGYNLTIEGFKIKIE